MNKFNFELDNVTYYAYIRYYEDGTFDVEIDAEDPPEEAYERAWEIADSEGYFDECFDESKLHGCY